MTVQHATNVMFWFVDKEIEAARRSPGWVEFHRECGKAGLYFDDIERSGGRRSAYGAWAYSASKDSRGFYVKHMVARGRAATPIAVTLECFDKAVAAGFPVDPAVRDLLTKSSPALSPYDEFKDILG